MTPMPKPAVIRARLIVNPFARNGTRLADLEAAERFLREHGWRVDRVHVERPDEVGEQAREAVEQGYNVVIVAGGDGSLGQAADALAGTDVALGIIPAGTGNILARDLGLPIPAPWYPHAFLDAARLLVESAWYRVDVGCLADSTRTRRFLNWCGSGFDATVTLRVEPFPEEKRRWGVAAYVLPAVQELLTYQPARWQVVVDDEHLDGEYYWLVVHNTQLYAGVLRLAPTARMDDGWLDLALVRAQPVQELLAHLWRVMLLGEDAADHVVVRRMRRARLVADPPQPVHVDGDPLTHTPITVWVEPQALTLILPGGERLPRHLLASAPVEDHPSPQREWLLW